VVQDQSKVILINSGQNNQAKYNLLPFLAQQGINTIDYGLAYDNSSNSSTEWLKISQRVRTKAILGSESHNLPAIKTALSGTFPEIMTKSARLTMDKDLNLINIQIADYSWLIIGKPANTENINQQIEVYIKQHHLASQQLVILFSGNIASRWLELLQPKMAIASNDQITHDTKQILQQKQIEFHNTAVESVIRWTPERGIIQTHNQLN
jgi:competence protein ComEC